MLWVYYTIPFSFSLFSFFILFFIFFFGGGGGVSLVNFFKITLFGYLRITDEGSVPEMRAWSMLLIKSDGVHFLVEVSFYISTTL